MPTIQLRSTSDTAHAPDNHACIQLCTNNLDCLEQHYLLEISSSKLRCNKAYPPDEPCKQQLVACPCSTQQHACVQHVMRHTATKQTWTENSTFTVSMHSCIIVTAGKSAVRLVETLQPC